MTKVKTVLRLMLAIAPSRVKRVIGNRLLGWDIHESALIGVSLLNVDTLIMGPGSRIGHFSVLRDLKKLELSASSRIGQWNWITAAAPLVRSPSLGLADDRRGSLIVGKHSAITSRHYIDCSGGITIGAYTTVAGVKSTILTHQIDVAASKQTISPVSVGDYCFIGSDVKITPGTTIGNECVIAMGAVAAGNLIEPRTLYGGVPARPIKQVDGSYFQRQTGFVWF